MGKTNKNENVLDRFLGKVNKTNDCWLWMGAKSRGYGFFSIDRKNYRAHRISYKLFIGDLDPNLCVLHHCDNPSCVNPDHLFVGTQKDNIKDCMDKNRFASFKKIFLGEENGASKLNGEKVISIRKMHKDGIPKNCIARMFNVDSKTIRSILQGKSWIHIKECSDKGDKNNEQSA